MILETETKQFIMIRVRGRASSSPHGGQKAEKKTERSQAERGRERKMRVWVPTNPSRPSSDCFKQVPPHKVSPSPKSHRLRSKP